MGQEITRTPSYKLGCLWNSDQGHDPRNSIKILKEPKNFMVEEKNIQKLLSKPKPFNWKVIQTEGKADCKKLSLNNIEKLPRPFYEEKTNWKNSSMCTYAYERWIMGGEHLNQLLFDLWEKHKYKFLISWETRVEPA